MRRVLPHPILSLSLAAMWLMLSGPIGPANLAAAVLVGLVVPFVMKALTPERSGLRWSAAMPRLALIVAADVVRSNWAVANIILGRLRRERVSGFVAVPLDMRNRHGLAVLAIIITSTPGTLWVQYDAGSGLLLIHVLDLVDEQEWIRLIKHRYERLLMEIFP